MDILDVCITYYFDRYLIFVGTSDPMVTHIHMGMGTRVNPYPSVDKGDLTGLFFYCGYEYGIVIPGVY
jgi:hypothetical protein